MLIVRSSKGRRLYGSLALSVPLALVASLMLAGVLLALFSRPAEAATTFTVNRVGDQNDRDFPSGTFDGSSNGKCDSSRTRGQQCTLRAAIQEANVTPGADVINFNIGSTSSVKTISPGSELPAITDTVTINGYTQRGAKENTLAEGNDAVLKVQLNGINAGLFADGLAIEASESTVKGLVINRFDGDGIEILGSSATDNKVEGNFIGTNAAGSTNLGNGGGVEINNAPNNTIGGTAAGARNVISGNEGSGVGIVSSSGSSATGNEVLGNFIGTTADGSGDLGNLFHGVGVFASNNTIGGTVAGARNVISGNDFNGVNIPGSRSTDNEVLGNFIGTDPTGTQDLGNSVDGVQIGAPNNTVGGTATEAGNRIAHNAGDGVSVTGSNNVGNSVLSNQIFANGGLGIDLGPSGVTVNDPVANKDSDTGANNLQNFPVITSATQTPLFPFGSEITIEGTLNSNPSQNFTVQCFLTGTPDGSGHGEGQAFKAEDTTVTTDPTTGNASFECKFLFIASLEGQNVSATATNQATGDTSEFSANVGITPGS